jgi:hypothetical protein
VADTRRPPRNKTLQDRAKEFVQDILEALDNLLPELEPELVPIPIRRPRR